MAVAAVAAIASSSVGIAPSARRQESPSVPVAMEVACGAAVAGMATTCTVVVAHAALDDVGTSIAGTVDVSVEGVHAQAFSPKSLEPVPLNGDGEISDPAIAAVTSDPSAAYLQLSVIPESASDAMEVSTTFTPEPNADHAAGNASTEEVVLPGTGDPVIWGADQALRLDSTAGGAAAQWPVRIGDTYDINGYLYPTTGGTYLRQRGTITDQLGSDPFTIDITGFAAIEDDGHWRWEIAVPSDNGLGDFETRYELYDAEGIVYSSPLITGSITPAPLAARARPGTRSEGGNVAVTEVDPDAVPAVDRLGVTGDRMLVLKEASDRDLAVIAAAVRVHRVLFDRQPSRTELARSVALLRAGVTTEGLAMALVSSKVGAAEFQASYPRSLRLPELVTIGAERVLGRTPTSLEVGLWAVDARGNDAARAAALAQMADAREAVLRNEAEARIIAVYANLSESALPSDELLELYAQNLRRGMARIQVVEAIALRLAPAEIWNAGTLRVR
jgi:hypothetical protein